MNIKETKEKIIDSLGDKTTAERLVKEYVEAEKKLLIELDRLKNGGGDCNCDKRKIINTIFDGEYPEILTYCINCGGYVDGA